MHLDCGFSDAHLAGSLLVQPALRDVEQDCVLTWRQCVQSRPKNTQSCLFLPACTIAPDPDIYGIQQILVSKGLCEELDRAPLHRLHGHWNVAVSGDEDDRKLDIARGEIALKIQPALSRQSHIEDQASRSVGRIRLLKIVNRCKESRMQAHGLQHSSQRFAKLRIIVDNDYTGL